MSIIFRYSVFLIPWISETLTKTTDGNVNSSKSNATNTSSNWGIEEQPSFEGDKSHEVYSDVNLFSGADNNQTVADVFDSFGEDKNSTASEDTEGMDMGGYETALNKKTKGREIGTMFHQMQQ